MTENRELNNKKQCDIHVFISSFLKEIAIANGKENANLAIQITDNSIEIIEITDDGYHNWIDEVVTINCL
jgi:hypothetical protein